MLRLMGEASVALGAYLWRLWRRGTASITGPSRLERHTLHCPLKSEGKPCASLCLRAPRQEQTQLTLKMMWQAWAAWAAWALAEHEGEAACGWELP